MLFFVLNILFRGTYLIGGGDIAVVDNGDLVGVALGKIGESGVFRGVPRIIWLIMNNVIVP